MDPEEVGRRHPVHHAPVNPGNLSVMVFVTVCAKDRRPILVRPPCVEAILKRWREADAWLVGRYVILPDHLHLFCAPRDLTVPFKNWIKFWKSRVSQQWPFPEDQPIWQRDFWDTQLRRDESYAQKWDYAWRNPVRHKLCERPEDWSYSGELNILRWHDR
jgi:putative transposase